MVSCRSLFDMDGTLTSSTDAVEGELSYLMFYNLGAPRRVSNILFLRVAEAWRVFQKTYTHVDVEHVLTSEYSPPQHPSTLHDIPHITVAHGIRTVDNLKNFCHVKDEDLEVRFC